jgi:small subunit ribosomal protein S11
MQSKGQVHVLATFNNTLVTVTDQAGNVLVWSSAGKCGFKGPKKATPYAAGVIVKAVADKAKEMGLREVEVLIKGVGAGREAAVRALAANGLLITVIKDITPMPHNGVRPKKPRRV